MKDSSAEITKDKIIACAIRLMQEKGYANLGLRELASEIGIKAPSFYHHFKSKAELAQTALRTYQDVQLIKLQIIDQHPCLSQRLKEYIALFGDMLMDNGYACFVMILALEKPRLDRDVAKQIDVFYKQNIEWLENTWCLGIAKAEIDPQLSPRQAAEVIFGALEGMMAFAVGEDNEKKNGFVNNALLLIQKLGVKKLFD